MDNCPRCEKRPPVSPVYSRGMRTDWCDVCIEDYAYTCNRCEKHFSDDNSFPMVSDGVCWDCLDKNEDSLFDSYMDRL